MSEAVVTHVETDVVVSPPDADVNTKDTNKMVTVPTVAKALDVPANDGRPPRKSSQSSSRRSSMDDSASRRRTKSVEEREEDANVAVDKWLVDFDKAIQELVDVQKHSREYSATKVKEEELEELYHEFLHAANNIHIVAHNIVNVITPLLPESMLHAGEHPSELGHLMHLVKVTAENADKAMEVPYIASMMRLGECGDFKEENKHRARAERACLTTGFYALQRTLRGTVCQVN